MGQRCAIQQYSCVDQSYPRNCTISRIIATKLLLCTSVDILLVSHHDFVLICLGSSNTLIRETYSPLRTCFMIVQKNGSRYEYQTTIFGNLLLFLKRLRLITPTKKI
ncbi:hypothetical protein VCUG_02669, partial [Vavraia culicis subsp. floridensis]